MTNIFKLRQLLVVGLMTLALPVCARADSGESTVPIEQLSLVDMMQMEVTTVSKKPQTLSAVAAAVSVITAEDI